MGGMEAVLQGVAVGFLEAVSVRVAVSVPAGEPTPSTPQKPYTRLKSLPPEHGPLTGYAILVRST